MSRKPKYDSKAPRLAFGQREPNHVPDRTYLTVRVGDKWLRNYIDGKTEVVILNPDGFPVASASIGIVCYLPLQEIPAHWLLRCEDEEQHTLAGLLRSMRATYSKAKTVSRRVDVQPDDAVSCVFYTVNEE